MSKTIWVNGGSWSSDGFSATAWERLRSEADAYRVVGADEAPGGLAEADIAFGQPDPEILMSSSRLQWAHITSAGYTRYDRDDLRDALRARGAILTNSSSVYDEPCAQHAVAMMLAFARQLPQALDHQHNGHAWRTTELRQNSFLLGGKSQTVLLLGFGAIVRRMVQLLAPFDLRLVAVRRNASSGAAGLSGVEIIGEADLEAALPTADHLVNVLPESPSTVGYLSAARLALLKKSALFYNIGRGATVDQPALIESLTSGRLAGAYLDVMTPEPLPPDHPLWSAPNCYITPHSAGGHSNEEERLIDHFLRNLHAYEQGKPLSDRIVG